jgi:putative oxidoreductase
MTAATPRPLVPGLAKIYPEATEWAYLLLRVVAGLMLIPHVWPKLMAGPSAVAANAMARRGIEPALLAAYLIIITEVLGAICITVGFLTRLVAALLVIEFLVIVKVHSAAGWMASAQGAEFPFIWLIVFVFILLRGGRPYSVDRKLGWEI